MIRLLVFGAAALMLAAACSRDARVLYEVGEGGGTTTRNPDARVVICPLLQKEPCFCPKGSTCLCNPEPEPLCSIDCPEGYCNLDCGYGADCSLTCGEGCVIECPPNAKCFAKCVGACTLICAGKSVCELWSYKSESEIICLPGASCSCPEGSICRCEGEGCKEP